MPNERGVSISSLSLSLYIYTGVVTETDQGGHTDESDASGV